MPSRPLGGILKRLSPRTLMGRAIVIMFAPLALTLAIATTFFYERHWDAVTRRLALGVAGDIGLIVENLDTLTRGGLLTNYLRSAREHLLIDFWVEDYAPLLPARRLVANRILDLNLAQAMAERVPFPAQIDTTKPGNWIEIRLQLPAGVGVALVHRDRLQSATTTYFVLAMVGASVILLAIALLFLRNQIRPIGRLAEAADAFGKGRDVTDFKGRGAVEVRQAAAAFNTMRQRIRRFVAQRTEMLAGVSHDLRTPLTRMKLQLAMMTGATAEDVTAMRDDVTEMERMLESYLAFARGDGAEAAVASNPAELLADVVGRFRREGADITLELGNLPGRMPLKPVSFGRCLGNLIANAVRYGRKVKVGAAHAGGIIHINVDDDGPGIPADKREEAFRAFHRLEPSRNTRTGGIGLGLTIARDLVHGMGGDISLGASPLGGLRATLRIPL